MQHAIERVERPGESQEALDGKKNRKSAEALRLRARCNLLQDKFLVGSPSDACPQSTQHAYEAGDGRLSEPLLSTLTRFLELLRRFPEA